MELDDLRKTVERMVQEGIVTAVDPERRKARVKFPATGLPSGWLYVLQSPPIIPGRRTEETAGGSGEGAFAAHSHKVTLTPWMPQVNDQVIVLYLPCPDSDGYIVGGI